MQALNYTLITEIFLNTFASLSRVSAREARIEKSSVLYNL